MSHASSNTQKETASVRLQHPGCTQSVRGVHTPAPFSAPDPSTLGQRVEIVPNLQGQWQPDAVLARQQETNAQTADEVLLQATAETYPGLNTQTCFPTNQGYDVGAGVSAWGGTSYDLQGEDIDMFWNTNFAFQN